MPSLLIANPGEKLSTLCNDRCHSSGINSSRFDAPSYLAAVQQLNPRLPSDGPIQGYQPILLPDTHTATVNNTGFSCELAGNEARKLGILSADMGGASVMALAALASKYDLYSIAADLNTAGGAGLGAATTRYSQFIRAVSEHDVAVATYEDLRNHRAAPATLLKQKAEVDRTFKKLQTEFNRELNALLRNHPARTQFVTIESPSGPRTASRSIPLLDANSMKHLSTFAKFGRVAGPGLVGLDGYIRYKQVNEVQRTGGNWQREAWAQGVGFAGGLAIGLVGFAIFLTPLGLIVGVLAAGAAALVADKIIVSGTRFTYDMISGG